VYLGLGSNLGDRNANIERAITLINERVGEVIRRSSLIETVPWGFDSENNFLNAVILCETMLTPRQVLRKTQKIERDLGRKKKTPSSNPEYKVSSSMYSDRPIDIDILLYDNLSVNEPDLIIPHPLMNERNFVMVPLREIRD
jgi:2-amino-4-hydroxy-6-hydroxymethyldihydropteridine diphosphokinase